TCMYNTRKLGNMIIYSSSVVVPILPLPEAWLISVRGSVTCAGKICTIAELDSQQMKMGGVFWRAAILRDIPQSYSLIFSYLLREKKSPRFLWQGLLHHPNGVPIESQRTYLVTDPGRREEEDAV
ncbi:hypothetical protein ACJX0J_013634, partial [Zea mays]